MTDEQNKSRQGLEPTRCLGCSSAKERAVVTAAKLWLEALYTDNDSHYVDRTQELEEAIKALEEP